MKKKPKSLDELREIKWDYFASPEAPQRSHSRRVIVTVDLFAQEVESESIRRAWDAMWCAPQHTFVVWASDVRRAMEWTRDNASDRHHEWIHRGAQPPMEPGEIVSLDYLYGRDRCGWANNGVQQNNGYGCSHPNNEEGGSCYRFACPIAYETVLCSNCEKDEEDCTCGNYERDDDAMELHSRPRCAMARNIVLGARIHDQGEAEGIFRDLSEACAMERVVELAPGVDVGPWIDEMTARYERDFKTSNIDHDGRVAWVVRDGVWRRARPQKKRSLPIVGQTA